MQKGTKTIVSGGGRYILLLFVIKIGQHLILFKHLVNWQLDHCHLIRPRAFFNDALCSGHKLIQSIPVVTLLKQH